MTVDQPLDVSDIVQSQIEQLVRKIEQLQERLLALYAKLSLMEDQAGLIRRDTRAASVYCRMHTEPS
jgi:hypothetical protein